MARPARIDLQSFQQELANRLASKTAAQVESSRLGLACGGERFLIRLGDAAEVVAVPPIASVPLTQSWFLGLANIRGNLYSVVDLAAFIGRDPVVLQGAGAQSR
ncbi:MAG TPA: chemotaxis protein CheW, partial [Casimicrobiaceae bacterium]|nr:chemotaxis protein CheW [Casimicrobiaceae bacterium]